MGAGLVPYFIVEFSCSVYTHRGGRDNSREEDKETRRDIDNLYARMRFTLKINELAEFLGELLGK